MQLYEFFARINKSDYFIAPLLGSGEEKRDYQSHFKIRGIL